MRRLKIFLTVFIILFVCLPGCSKTKPSAPVVLTAAEEKFLKICREEYKLNITTKRLKNTYWIYVTTPESLFDFESENASFKKPGLKFKQRFSVLFTDGKFEKPSFHFEYDIIDKKKSPEGYGYKTSYSKQYSKIHNNIFTAVAGAFLDVDPGSTPKLPDFFVTVVADITRGIEAQGTFYIRDFKRYMSGDLPHEEYIKRYLSKTKGDTAIINDKSGAHLDYKETEWPQFNSEQILNRMAFQFAQSDFPPQGSAEDAILKIIADTTRYYQFDDFDSIRLNNLRTATEYLFDKKQLATFAQ